MAGAKKGSERFGAEEDEARRAPSEVPKEQPVRSARDEEEEQRRALTEHGSEDAVRRGYLTPPET